MKSRVAIALSVVGVLTSGSAAVLFNTQAMRPPEVASSVTAEPAVTTTPTADQVIPTPTSSVKATTTTATIAATTTTTAPTTTTTTTSTIAPGTTVPPTTLPPASVTEPTTPAAPTQPSAAAATIYTFEIPGAGVTRLDTANGQLTVAETKSTPGWVVNSIRRPTSTRIEIVFVSSTLQTTFAAEYAGDMIYTYIESKNR